MLNDHENQSPEDRKFQKELNAGLLSLVLLALLADSEEPLYGYEVAKLLEARAPLAKQGTFYPVLRALEAQGFLSSRVEPSTSGPPRKYYSVTPEGRRALARWAAIWSHARACVDGVLGGRHD